MKKEYCVYAHTNKVNGKKYIGITSMIPEKRWANGSGYRKNTLFYRAIQKYGWESFDHEILFEGLNKKKACEEEVRLIKEFNLTNPHYGYNIDKGGNGSNRITETTRKKLSDGQKRYFRDNPDAKQANDERLRRLACDGSPERHLRKYQSDHPEWAGEHSRWLKDYYAKHPEIGAAHSAYLKEYYKSHPELRVIKSKQTKQFFINHPEARKNCAEKAREYYRHHPEARQQISDRMKQFFKDHPEKKTGKKVSQFSLDGNHIKDWNSCTEAGAECGINYKLISACAIGRQRTAGGYVWRYSNALQVKAI